MENISLYEYIENLKQAKEKLHTLGKKLRFEGVSIETIRKEVGGRIKAIEDRLEEIDNKYAIDYKKLIQIINKQRGKKHKLKCFKEVETIWEVNNGSMSPNNYYTGRYWIGFISEESKFSNFKENDLGYSVLNENEFAEMIKSLNKKNSIVLNGSGEYGYPKMFHLDLVKNKNYIQMVTHDYRFWNDFYEEAIFGMLDLINEELQNVEYKQKDVTTSEDLGL